MQRYAFGSHSNTLSCYSDKRDIMDRQLNLFHRRARSVRTEYCIWGEFMFLTGSAGLRRMFYLLVRCSWFLCCLKGVHDLDKENNWR